MKSMHHKYMHLCRIADAYNKMHDIEPRSKSSAMFVARAHIGLDGNVRLATHAQMDQMIDYLQSLLPANAVKEPTGGRQQTSGREKFFGPLNRSRKNEYQSRWFRKKYASDQLFLLMHSMRRSVSKALRKNKFVKKQKTMKIVGCTPHELKLHIEKQFLPGMSWSNKKDWHIDHIVPISSAKTEDELLSICHFTNLRPLWAADNQKKSNQRTHLI